MRLLRSTLFSVYMILTTMLTGLAAFLLFPLPYRLRYTLINLYARALIRVLALLCGITYHVEGREHIRHPAIIFCKHQSTWETYALQVVFPPLSYVFKQELFWIPFFGWGLFAMKPIAIQRGSGRKAVRQLVSGGIRRLQEGLSVVIFPEGTRTKASGPGRYKIGGAVLAAESGYPVIPVAHNAGEFWARKSFIKTPGHITLRIGPAIETTGKKPEQVLEEARSWIEAQMPQITHGVYRSDTSN